MFKWKKDINKNLHLSVNFPLVKCLYKDENALLQELEARFIRAFSYRTCFSGYIQYFSSFFQRTFA